MARPKSSKSAESPKDLPFRFYDSGQFCFNPDHHHDAPLSGFITHLCQYRRSIKASPFELALAIRASEHVHSFSSQTLDQWETLKDDSNWPQAVARRSSEQAVKDAGFGETGCMKLHLERHPATDQNVRDAMELVHQLVGKMGLEDPARPVTVGTATRTSEPDEQWFERRGFNKPVASWEELA